MERYHQQVFCKAYVDIAQLCRDEARKAKAWMEMNLAMDAKNKKGFYRYVTQKRKVKETVHS